MGPLNGPAEAVRYTPPVSKGVAWVVLMALLTLVSVDRVVCADGCTDSGAASACDCDETAPVPDSPHSCVLCTTGLEEPPLTLPTLSPLGLIGSLTVEAWHSVASVPPPLLDHPPRSILS